MNGTRIVAVISGVIGLAASAPAAWAGDTVLPEPSTMGIFAIGAGAAYLLHRFLKKR